MPYGATGAESRPRGALPRWTLGWGFEPQITRLGGGCPFRARLPEYLRRGPEPPLILRRADSPTKTFVARDTKEASGSEFFRGLLGGGKFFFRPMLRGGFRFGRRRPLPRFLRRDFGGRLFFPGPREGLRLLRFRLRLGFRLLLLVFLDEADRLEFRELPKIGHDPEFRHEPLLVRLADVREMDFRAPALQIELELICEAVVHVDDCAHALLRRLGLPLRLHDVLQRLARKRVVEVDSDATGARGGDDAVFPADRDFQPDFRADLLPEKFPFRAKLDEPRVSDPCTFFRGNQHLNGLPDLRPNEGGLEAFEQATTADDHGDLDVDFLLIELPLFLRDLVVGRVEESQGPVRIHRPGVVLNPDDVPFLDRV